MSAPEASTQVGEASSSSPAAQNKQPTSNGAPKQSKPENESGLSPAEQKKLKKAEAKARREKQVREKQARGDAGSGPSTGAQHGSPGNKSGADKSQSQSQDSSGRGHQSGGPKELHHKRTGSGHHHHSDAQHRALPVRGAVKRGGSSLAVTQKDPKEVALFGHLYGHPRRMSVAGAARDIHPAVLALGLQMSSYIICGSNARCVATLFCFKRVRPFISRPHAFSIHPVITTSH